MTPAAAAPLSTPLGDELKARIERDGPISVADFMHACLQDPAHGYYRKRDAIGSAGDFVTAPEISQVFGELIGLWCAVVWQSLGEPSRVRLVELGPGRGTLMRDALRAARALKDFRNAVQVDLVETNAALTAVQRETLREEDVPIRWSEQLQLAGDGVPVIVIGNEFLDTLAVSQWVLGDGGWSQRCVGLDDQGGLAFVTSAPDPALVPPPHIARSAGSGSIYETRAPAFASLARSLAAAGAPLAALFIDYGHTAPGLGDTLQAVRAHRYDDPLAAPGEADLTAQVDFTAFAEAVRACGLYCDGPATQAEFLGGLGIVERASRLMAANPAKAATIEADIARLMAPGGMGTRFSVIGVRTPSVPPMPALAPVDNTQRAP
jgi:NADH dehydrogenase [ubiquinone] 1 alpha subcomplex assembly factor 7